MTAADWQLEMGAQVIDGGTVRFRVWAPASHVVEVELYPPPEGIVRHAMEREGDGVWSAEISTPPGTLYRYRLNEEWGYPDPYSRSQPEGVHGPSQVVDPLTFRWTDGGWRGLDRESLVIYECHAGAYTPEGTFDALIGQLDELASLGVTALELMPVAEFPGRRNWGYDGVDLFAASSAYGGPEALRRLVDAAHDRGLGVILDVVYNHLGPDGNYLHAFSPDYFTDRYQTPWGDAVNFDGANSDRVRRFFIDNALFWLHEFHIDGLRLDATHAIFDESPKHILAELAEAVEAEAPPERRALLIAENERNDLRLILPREASGYGLDGLWLDDFHHSIHVLLTGERQGYLGRFEGTAAEIARLLREGLLYQSPASEGVDDASKLAASRLVYCLQNHDVVGNRALGDRLAQLTDLELYKAAYALLLLSPCTPLIFMGDEFAATTPFHFFSDHEGELGDRLAAGRREEFKEFWAGHDLSVMPDPQSEATFAQSKLDLSEREKPRHDGVYCLFRELLRLRREDPVLREEDRSRVRTEAIGRDALAMERWAGGARRLLLVNFGESVRFDTGEQAWLGEAASVQWHPILSTAEARFAGPGAELEKLALRSGAAIELPPRCALLWAAEGT